jgi:hypothetical protein
MLRLVQSAEACDRKAAEHTAFPSFHVIDAEGDRALAGTPNPAAALASEIDDDLPGIAGRDFLQDRAQPARPASLNTTAGFLLRCSPNPGYQTFSKRLICRFPRDQEHRQPYK